MAKKKAAALPPAVAQRKTGPRSGFVKATFSIPPDQLEALQAEAMRRAQERRTMRPDASELVREALAAWLTKRR